MSKTGNSFVHGIHLAVVAIVQFLVRIGLVIVCMVALFTLFASDVGVIQNYFLKSHIIDVQAEIAHVKQENESLERKLYSLRNDLEMVEFIARHDLRLVRKDEILFDLSTEGYTQDAAKYE